LGGAAFGARPPLEVVADRSDPTDSPALRQVPSPLGAKILLFEFIVLIEYWTAPLFLNVTNYAGAWSGVGTLLFVLLVTTLAFFVLLPLIPHLRIALAVGRDRWLFHGIWMGSLAVGLVVTSTIQWVSPATGSGTPVELGRTTIYTAFGAWPSLTILVSGLHLFATVNLEVPTTIGLLSVLSAAAVLLGPVRRARACARGAPRKGLWGSRLASVAIWSPFGFITGCASCAPAYLALLALVAPATAASGYSAVPLVPWIGLAGLLYVASLGLALHILRQATREAGESIPPGGEDYPESGGEERPE
jgi:hypothetical protein